MVTTKIWENSIFIFFRLAAAASLAKLQYGTVTSGHFDRLAAAASGQKIQTKFNDLRLPQVGKSANFQKPYSLRQPQFEK